MRLAGADAFDAIEALLVEGRQPDAPFDEPLFARIHQALHRGPPPSPLDLAVLVRQALRYQTMQDPDREPVQVAMERGAGWPTELNWRAVGVEVAQARRRYLLRALPWLPHWLPDVGINGVDAASASAAPRRLQQLVLGDPFLSRLGRSEYLSPGQRASVRAALMIPAGGTLLVCLPTGEGKSLVFQVVAEFGFGDGGPDPGVTLVVTPTVALALDQERAALACGMPDIPRAFVGGNLERNREIAAHIADGRQGLCFASPEAVCGSLRPSLIKAAQGLHLRAFVIDEAHLVDAWGANFRPEFQLLSGVRQDLLHSLGSGRRFRTILLSATMADDTVTTLRKLFGPEADAASDQFAICGTVSLRPEIDYWVSKAATPDEQQQCVLEAVHHLPRPAILYVTEVEAAQLWGRRLQQKGFRRLACMTGETSEEERRRIVQEWREGCIDLVVSTSAFGLGIDNPDVRTVIHACVPETLDRFYQEVGRGGRDGRASTSLVIYTSHDLRTAESLNQRRLITVDRGLERWEAMFRHPSCIYHGEGLFTVRLDLPPATGERDIDMVSEGNTQWNARTLSLMAKAGLLSLQGPEVVHEISEQQDRDFEPEEQHPAQIVRILDQRHLDADTWSRVVAPERQRLKSAFYQNLERLKQFLQQQECIAHILAPLYELHVSGDDRVVIPVTQACGGCPRCRRERVLPWHDYPRSPALPWKGVPPAELLASMLGADNRMFVLCPSRVLSETEEDRPTASERRRLREVLSILINSGFRNLIVLPGIDIDMQRLQADLHWVFFLSDSLAVRHLPSGPAVVIAPPDARLEPSELRRARRLDEARVFFLSEEFRDPDRVDVRFSETNDGRQWRLSEFQRRIG